MDIREIIDQRDNAIYEVEELMSAICNMQDELSGFDSGDTDIDTAIDEVFFFA